MDELFSGYEAVTPEFRVVETDRAGRPYLHPPTGNTDESGAGVKSEFGARGRRKRHEEDIRNERTVFVGNLPPTITRRKLKQLFSQHGKVESVRLRSMVVEKGRLPVRVAKRKQEQILSSNVNSYVVFTEEECARKALELNGALVGDRHIRVNMAARGKEHIHERSVFVGGLPYGIDDEELRTVFQKYGDVESVRVVREPKTGVGKGFGFVTFHERSGVMFALQSGRKMELNGQKLRVMKSKDMSQREKSGSVAKFSGTQVKGTTAAKSVTKKGGGRKVDRTNVKKSGGVRRNSSQLKTVIKQRDGEDTSGGKETAKRGGAVSERVVRPSRTFHKKKEARKREKEQRKKELVAKKRKTQQKSSQNQSHFEKSDTKT